MKKLLYFIVLVCTFTIVSNNVLAIEQKEFVKSGNSLGESYQCIACSYTNGTNNITYTLNTAGNGGADINYYANMSTQQINEALILTTNKMFQSENADASNAAPSIDLNYICNISTSDGQRIVAAFRLGGFIVNLLKIIIPIILVSNMY